MAQRHSGPQLSAYRVYIQCVYCCACNCACVYICVSQCICMCVRWVPMFVWSSKRCLAELRGRFISEHFLNYHSVCIKPNKDTRQWKMNMGQQQNTLQCYHCAWPINNSDHPHQQNRSSRLMRADLFCFRLHIKAGLKAPLKRKSPQDHAECHNQVWQNNGHLNDEMCCITPPALLPVVVIVQNVASVFVQHVALWLFSGISIEYIHNHHFNSDLSFKGL